MKKGKKRHAFTLVELMVVIVIIAFIMALLLPALRGARKKAQAMACASNLRQLGVACATYAADFDGYFPAVTHTAEYGVPGRGISGTYTPWPYFFVNANYVDSRKIYYCKAADVDQDLTISELDDDSDVALYRNADGGTYGMNLGVSCNVFDQAGTSTYFDNLGIKTGWELLPGQVHTIYAPEDKVLMGDWAPTILEEDAQPPLWPLEVPRPPNPSWEETMYTNCAIWGVPPGYNDNIWQYARLDFRHPGRRANVLFCDMHVGSVRSDDRGVFFVTGGRGYSEGTYREGINSSEWQFWRWAAYARAPLGGTEE